MLKCLLRWAVRIPPDFLMAIVGRLVAPVLPFFVQADGYLPRWLWWFQTPDNPCDGDAGHWKRWPRSGGIWTYLRRLAWFPRNVCYGFGICVVGTEVLGSDRWVVEGNAEASDQKTGLAQAPSFRAGSVSSITSIPVRGGACGGTDHAALGQGDRRRRRGVLRLRDWVSTR